MFNAKNNERTGHNMGFDGSLNDVGPFSASNSLGFMSVPNSAFIYDFVANNQNTTKWGEFC